ncbi:MULTISPECIES: HAD family phosphatase [Marinomonas]|uniref:HAD superfamily hydrolase (TIGR01509 family) n=1 Tax=Marinomonas alcarazii TaxID=491949 RepID=A0A318V9E2_9GAMM|nr:MULTISPECIES: HAD family phosphatase [Marinomonas]PYF84530.1 HAD superfamily hydrolase (TIGR01509 family) [Marinomonas alcarazii]
MTYSYKAIIFDCDGVIVDTENISNTILKTMLSECGLELDDETLHAKFTGFTNQENLINAEKLLGKPLPANFDEDYRQRFHAVIEADLEPIKGVRNLLNKITVPIAMATNARRKEMDFKLNKIQLAERFATRFCVEDVDNGKPAPDLYLKAAKALNVTPEDCLVIEDSIAGITAGRAAGMRVLAYSETLDAQMQTAAGATQCFKTMKELEGLLGI